MTFIFDENLASLTYTITIMSATVLCYGKHWFIKTFNHSKKKKRQH